MRNKVYICSAFRGDTEENIRKTKKCCRWAATECGVIPIAPHLLFPQFLDDENETERELGISYGLELLADCSALWYFGDRVTQGMVIEINEASAEHEAFDRNAPTYPIALSDKLTIIWDFHSLLLGIQMMSPLC